MLHRALVHELKQSKSSLQAQLKGMVAAEHSLTKHLKETHLEIDGQLQQLREQLKVRLRCEVQMTQAISADDTSQ